MPSKLKAFSIYVFAGITIITLIGAILLTNRGNSHQNVPLVLTAVSAASAQLMVDTNTFEVRGVNYIRPTTADPECAELHFGANRNCPWDHTLIEADLAQLQTLGVNTVRIFLNYYVFGGARESNPSYDMQPALEHLDTFITSANRRGIYVLPVLFDKYPQDRFGPDHYTSALDLHLRPIMRHLTGRSGLLGWDIFNEPDIGSPIDVRCWDWDNGDFPLCLPLANERMRFLAQAHAEVKRLNPHHLTTIGMAFAKSYFEPIAADLQMAPLVDFYSFHYYDNDPYDSGRYVAHWYYGQGFPHDLRRGIDELMALPGDKPIVITEVGFPTDASALRTQNNLRHDLQIAALTTREASGSGIVLWPFQSKPEELVGDLFIRSK